MEQFFLTCWVENKQISIQNITTKVRISIGPSSTARLDMPTGPPLIGAYSLPVSCSIFQLIFFISFLP